MYHTPVARARTALFVFSMALLAFFGSTRGLVPGPAARLAIETGVAAGLFTLLFDSAWLSDGAGERRAAAEGRNPKISPNAGPRPAAARPAVPS